MTFTPQNSYPNFTCYYLFVKNLPDTFSVTLPMNMFLRLLLVQIYLFTFHKVIRTFHLKLDSQIIRYQPTIRFHFRLTISVR